MTAVAPPPPDNPNVGRAGGIMMASLFLSRVLGLVRNAVIAAMFGQSLDTAAYIQSFKVADLIFYLVAGGALSSAFIPVFSEYLHTGKEEDAWHIFSAVTTLMTILVTVAIVLAWIFAPQLIHVIAQGTPESWDLAIYMSRIVLPAQLAFFVGGLMFGTLYARQRFAVPGLGPNLYNLGIIFGAVAISHFVDPAVAGLSWGALAGAFVGNIIVPFFAMRNSGTRFRPTLNLSHPGVKKVFRLMLPVILGLSLPAIYGLVMSYFVAFYGVEMVAALDNSDRIMQAPLAVFGQSLALAAFPALTQFFAQNKMGAYRDQLSKTLRTVLYLSIPVSALLIAMPEGVIKILLEHGNFGLRETARTAPILQVFAICVAAWCMQPVLMRAYFAIQQTVRPILISSATTGLFVGLCYLLPMTPLRQLGLPLAGSISAAVLVIALLFGLKPFTGGFDAKGILETLGKCIIASTGMAVPCWLASQKLLTLNVPKAAFMGLFVLIGLVGIWVYIWITRAFKMPEAAYVDRAMRRLNRKGNPDSDDPDGGGSPGKNRPPDPDDPDPKVLEEEMDIIDPDA